MNKRPTSSESVRPASKEFEGTDLVAITGTQYRDRADIRFELSLQTTEAMRDADVPYIVVDSSPEDSAPWVHAAHQNRGAQVLTADTPGIATQRQQGVAYAVGAGAGKVLSAEPEKTLMPSFADVISDSLDSHDVLVIGRTSSAEASLPPVQRAVERLAGWVLQRTLQLPADTLSGGRGFTVAGANHLAAYPAYELGMNNWKYLYDVPLAARDAGLSVGGLLVDLLHPSEMVEEETGNPVFDRKRYDQFKLQLDHLLIRSDVDPKEQKLAVAILSELDGVTPNTSTQELAANIARIEELLIPAGYTKPL